jgi:hypothetical protein
MASPTTYIGTFGLPTGGFTASAMKEMVLSDLVNIDWTETPLQSMLAKTPIGNVEPQWLIDTHYTPNIFPNSIAAWNTTGLSATANASSINTWEENFHTSAVLAVDSQSPRVRNYTQLISRGWTVSKSAQKVSQNGYALGRPDEYAFLAGKALIACNKDLEAIMIRTHFPSGQSATGAADRVMKGLLGGFHATASNQDTAISYVTGGVTAGATATALGGFSTADFLSVQGRMWAAGAKPDTAVMPMSVKANAASVLLGSAGGPGRVQYNTSNMNAWELMVDIVRTDYGTCMLIPNIYMSAAVSTTAATDNWSLAGFNPTGTTVGFNAYHAAFRGYFILEKAKIQIGVFRPFETTELPELYNGRSGYIDGEFSLIVRHPSAIGYVHGVTA